MENRDKVEETFSPQGFFSSEKSREKEKRFKFMEGSAERSEKG